MRHFKLRDFGLAVLLVFGVTSGAACAAELRVAVAANFSAPLTRIVLLFEKESGHTVQLNPGASGKLYAQIKNGAPFDVFLAADDELPKRLVREGAAQAGSRFVYATGRLALWSMSADFVDAKGVVLNQGNFSRLAIADPRLAPYGVAAQETLTKLFMWNAIQRKLVKGENITQTYQFVATENAELGFIALSQIMLNGKISTGSWWLVPAEMHQPLHQSAVLLSAAKDKAAAQAFLDFLKRPQALAIMRGYGYEFPLK
jgi:molybdate transport system substrate-binding protein